MNRLTRQALLAILLVGQALAFTYCRPPAATVPAVVVAAQAQARRDSTHAARLDTTAARYYALAQAAEDSATFYHLQTTHVQATAIDTAALRSFFTDYSR